MKEENKSSILEVTDERAATLLLKEKTRRLLAPFVGTKRSVGEASDLLGIKLPTLYPYVQQFCRAGLVRVVQTVPRAGRAVRYYQTVADEFFVPSTVSPLLAHYEALSRAQHDLLLRATLRVWSEATLGTPAWGFRLYVHPDVGFMMMGAQAKGEPWDLFRPDDPVILPYWRKLKLGRNTAQALQLELHNLLERYTAGQDGPDEYLLHVAMAPLTGRSDGA